jgi:hypothetical protein
MLLAKDLGKSLQEVMELSTLELRMWAAFYKFENSRQEKTNKRKR